MQKMFGDRIWFSELTRHHTHDVINEQLESGALVITIDQWKPLHTMQKLISVDWDLTVPFGLLAAEKPDKKTTNFLNAVKQALALTRF